MALVDFSSDTFSAALDDVARFRAWQDHYMAHHGHLDLRRPEDRPFSLRFTFTPYGAVAVGQFAGTFGGIARTPHHIIAKPSDTVCVVLNRGRTRLTCSHGGREYDLEPEGVTMFLDSVPSEGWGEAENKLLFVPVPRSSLAQLIDHPEDLTGRLLDPSKPATRHLKRYLALLSQYDDTNEDDQLSAHIGATVLDLIALALGATKDVAQRAHIRGLRAARVQDVIARIAAGFANPAFSPGDVAADLGVSERYVQDLLQETGSTFTARLLELRLQRARHMLSDFRCDRLKVSEIANACGFNEIPYFNRCFRRRFGESPTGFRADVSARNRSL